MSDSEEILNEIKINSLISSEEFVNNIEKFATENNIEYIDAVVEYCKRNNIEIETAASIIKSTNWMKTKIQKEAQDLRVINIDK